MPLDPNCYERVDLFISATDLPKMQMFSGSDCFAVIYMRDRVDFDKWHKLHTTQVKQDTQKPVWTDHFPIDYYFELDQKMKVKIFHSNPKESPDDEDKHKYLGCVDFTLCGLMRADDSKLELDITEGEGKGMMTIKGEAETDTRDLFVVNFKGKKMKNRDGFFGKSDPFLIISRLNESNEFTVVWQSDKLDNTLDPVWPEYKIPVNQLCGGDLRRPLKIEVKDHNDSGKHKDMGVTRSSVKELVDISGSGDLQVTLKEKPAGTLEAVCHIQSRPTFTQFVRAGIDMSVTIAIDYTGSNGQPEVPESLHHINPSGNSKDWNPYQRAIKSICSIVDYYDTDKAYSVFGFGARLQEPGNPQPSEVKHSFPVGEGEHQGIDGVFEAYEKSVTEVMMSGPTLFQEIIEKAAGIARNCGCSQEAPKYNILLIITDGCIHDMRETKQALIDACDVPLSVLIIGVGPEDFSAMRELDSDDKLLEVRGKKATRDIVQFIDNTNNTTDGWMSTSQKVLAEIPDQLLAYMEAKGITPN